MRTHRLLLVILVAGLVCLSFLALGGLWILVTGDKKANLGPGGQELYQDFRGKELDLDLFRPFGPAAAELLKTEPGGLRIALSNDRKVQAPVGVLARFPIQGDFEITTRYEILRAEPPSAGFGVGFAVYLMTSSPARDATEFFHLVRQSGREVYACARITTVDGRRVGIPNLDVGDRPATGMAGQMRIVRRGAELVLSAAGPLNKDFQELYRFAIGADDVSAFRVGVNPGNAPNPVDARVIDLRIRSN